MALALATAAVQLGPWRYQAVPDAAVAVDDYVQIGTPWFTSRRGADIKRDGEAPQIELTGGPGIAYAARWVRPVAGAAYTRVTLDLALDEVTPNSRGFGAFGALVSFAPDGRRLAHWPKELFDAAGTESWRRVSLTVPWADAVAMMRLELVQAADQGRVMLRRVTVEPLADAPWYPWAHGGLIGAWILLGAAAVTMAVRQGRPRRPALAATAAAMLIVIGGVLPEPVFRELITPVEQPLIALGRAVFKPAPTATASQRTAPPERTAAATPSETRPAPTPAPAAAAGAPASTPAADAVELTREGLLWVRSAVGHKVMHATGFGGLALLVAFVAPPVGLLHFAGVAGFAIVTEVLQMLTVTRSAHLSDVGIDWLSAAFGLALGVSLRLILARWRAGA